MKPVDRLSGGASSAERRRTERRSVPGLAACHGNGLALKQNGVRDISATGMYLLTQERWLPGALITLSLQREDLPEENPERQVTLQTMVVRRGEDGAALSFILPEDLDLRLWSSPFKYAWDRTEPEDILREFRMAKAVAFLTQISLPAVAEIKLLLRERLSNLRLESAVEIALKAERLLELRPDAAKLRAHPGLVVRILEDGSGADEDWRQQLWAGLLATSCTLDGNDESNLVFVELLSQLTSTHVRVFIAACGKAARAASGLGRRPAKLPCATVEEIKQAVGTGDILRIRRDLDHLADLGLLEKGVQQTFYSPAEDGRIVPTNLGLQFFTRCHVHRGSPETVYVAFSPNHSAPAAEV